MTHNDTLLASRAERSASRWARALYAAAFSAPPEEVTSTTEPRLNPTLIQFSAYPALNQAPLSISMTGLIREPAAAPVLLGFAQRFETTLKLAVAPITSAATQPDFDAHPRPQAAATARGPAGAVTVVEHEPHRRPHHQPWLTGDPIILSLQVPHVARSGLLIPERPLRALISSPIDSLEVPVHLSPTRDALNAKLLPPESEPLHGTSILRWAGSIVRSLPPFELLLSLVDPGSLSDQPFATASWMLSDSGFAIRLLTGEPPDNSEPTT